MAQLFNKKAEAAAITPRPTSNFSSAVVFSARRGVSKIDASVEVIEFFMVLIYMMTSAAARPDPIFIFTIYLTKIIMYRNDADVERWLLALNQQRQTLFLLCQFP